MRTTEEKEQAVAEGEQEEACHAADPRKPLTWRFLIPIVAFGAGFVPHFLAGWFIFPLLLYGEKQQPIDFNHKIHQEAVDEGCEICHFFSEY